MTAGNGNRPPPDDDDGVDFGAVERTSPGVLKKHPALEQPSLPPDAPLEDIVQQLLGGHTELRGRVDKIGRDVATLLSESTHSARTAEERHRSTTRGQKMQSAGLALLLILGAVAQLYLTHGGHG